MPSQKIRNNHKQNSVAIVTSSPLSEVKLVAMARLSRAVAESSERRCRMALSRMIRLMELMDGMFFSVQIPSSRSLWIRSIKH